MSYIHIIPSVKIPERELIFSSTKSSGPGGQHVNTTNSKVILRWYVEASASLSLSQKDYFVMRMSHSVKKDGAVQIQCDKFRSQERNRQECISLFIELLQKGLFKPKPRKKTRVSKTQKKKRLEAKKRRGQTKKDRREAKINLK